jgi:hypothetical protein
MELTMVCCRKISRLFTLVGFYAFAGAIASSASAAPLCARVMMPEISASDMSATIASLASMKIRLDSLKTENSSSHELIVLQEKFPLILAELQKSLGNQKSENEIRELLVAEIAKQQGRIEEHRLKEAATRKEEEVLTPLYTWKLKQDLQEEMGQSNINYIPEREILLWRNEDTSELLAYDLRSGISRLLVTDVSEWKIFPDRKTVLVRKGWALSLHDLDTNKRTNIKVFTNADAIRSIKLTMTDPTNQFLFVPNVASGGKRYNLHDGRHINLDINISDKMTVLSKDLLLIADKSKPYIMNVETKETFQFGELNSAQTQFVFLKADRSQFAFYDLKGNMTVYDIKDVSAPVAKYNLPLPANEALSELQIIPGSFQFVGKHSVGDADRRYGVFNINNTEKVSFIFDNYKNRFDKDGSINPRFIIASDGKSIATLSQNSKWQYELHIWERSNLRD